MSRDITADDRDRWDEADDTNEPYEPYEPYELYDPYASYSVDAVLPVPSVLDRGIELPAHAGLWLATTAALLIGLLLRFIGLDRWPMTVAGANVAQSAFRLVHGDSVPAHLFGAPFVIDWTALFFFAGSDLDSIARLAMAVAGFATLVLLLGMRPWWGACFVTVAVALAALSPTLVASARRVDGGALYVMLTLAIVVAAQLAHARPGLAWPAVVGAATAALWMTGPLGIPAILLAWLAVALYVRPKRLPAIDALLAGGAAGFATLILTTTVFLTRPGSFTASISENVERLWKDHLSDVGSSFQLPAYNLILNEPLLLILAVVGVVCARELATVRASAIWFGAAFLVMSILGSVGTGGYALVVLPLVVLAATGGEYLVQRVPWSAFRRGPAALYLGCILLMAMAITSLLGLLIGGTGDDTGEWLLKFALIVLVGLLPLALAISAVGVRIAGSRLVLILMALLSVASLLTVRSSVLAASERPGVPGDPLSVGAIGADIPIVIDRLERVSRDMTMAQRTSQDPTGGHGLHIAIDRDIEQPFAWYFRDFPDLTIFDPETEAPPQLADIIILADTRDSKAVAPGYTGQTYLYQREQPEALHDPEWGDLVSGIFNPDQWRRFAEYVLYREPAVKPAEHSFQLLATGEVASRLFPSSGPFALGDRPGPGAAPGQFNQPRGIAVGPDGNTYVVDSRNSRVEKFAATGEFLFEFGGEGSGEGQLGRFATAGGGGANGIAIGEDGNVYVADTWNHRIVVYTAEGVFVRAWGQFYDAADDPTATQSHPGEFYGPRGIAAHDGQIYVTDTGNERVQMFSEDGTFVRMLGTPGSSDSQLREPVGTVVNAAGEVLVADSHNARIARFAADGTWLAPWPVEQWSGQQFFEPYLALGPDGSVYASASTAGVIAVFGPDGTVGIPISGQELRQPFGVAVTLDGTSLLITDGTLHAVITVLIPQP